MTNPRYTICRVLYLYCTLQVLKCSGQSCALGAMSNFAKMRPDMTSRTRSYLTNQIFRISGEKLEMQLYKKISSLSQMVWGPAKKNHLWGWQPPSPRCERGLIQHPQFIQVCVCQVSCFYAFALRRYWEEENGGENMPPKRLAGIVEVQRPQG